MVQRSWKQFLEKIMDDFVAKRKQKHSKVKSIYEVSTKTEADIKKIIKDVYSSAVIIVDEAQHLRANMIRKKKEKNMDMKQ